MSRYLQVYRQYLHRRHVQKASACPCGIIKAHTFGYGFESHERSSQNDTRQGIHE